MDSYEQGMYEQFDGEVHVCKDGEYHAGDARDCDICNNKEG